MATYAIGDVQGCWRTLARLLERIGPGAGDRLWLAGDLVNRGRGSLEVLRWAARSDATVVLGNHDLHLLGCAAGVRRPSPKDTLDPVLAAPDRGDLLDWLAARPLLVRERVGPDDVLLVHAGLLPEWSADEARALAEEAAAALGSDREAFLRLVSTREGPLRWGDVRSADDRLRLATVALTRLRCLGRAGEVALDYTGPPAEAPPDLVPWFEAPGRRSAGSTVVFGHWAALGLVLRPGVVALDSGCVWGNRLTAVRLEDRAVFQEPADPADLGV